MTPALPCNESREFLDIGSGVWKYCTLERGHLEDHVFATPAEMEFARLRKAKEIADMHERRRVLDLALAIERADRAEATLVHVREVLEALIRRIEE